jgi:hypothetical protein
MRDQLVPIYHGRTVDDTQRLADKLRAAGIESFVNSTQSPMYGMRAGPSARTLFVREPVMDLVREIVHEFRLAHPGVVERADRDREETGLELPTGDRPADDSPAEGIAEMTEEMDAERPGPDTPEMAAVHEELDEEAIHSMDVDRDYAQQAEVESEEVEDQPLDELDTGRAAGEGPRERPEEERRRRAAAQRSARRH